MCACGDTQTRSHGSYFSPIRALRDLVGAYLCVVVGGGVVRGEGGKKDNQAENVNAELFLIEKRYKTLQQKLLFRQRFIHIFFLNL